MQNRLMNGDGSLQNENRGALGMVRSYLTFMELVILVIKKDIMYVGACWCMEMETDLGMF